MFPNLPLAALVFVFVVGAAGVWAAGIYLSETTDILSERLDIGEDLGGMIFLAVVTNLPEVAITASGAWRQDLGIAVGNILGGISIQTLVLVALDAVGLSKEASLSCRAASPSLVLEGALVIAVLAVAIMGSELPPSLIYARVTPAGAMITGLWIVGVWVIGRMRTRSWPDDADARSTETAAECVPVEGEPKPPHKMDTTHAVVVFVIGAAVTLVCGVILEISSEVIAARVGMSGVLFGATILAAVTALPQLSSGMEAVKLGDYRMAVSDVLGGNAFLPVLFLPATLLSGQAVLPLAQKTDIYLSALGILLTAVYMTGLIYRPTRQILRMGIDSFAVLVLYLVGILGLVAVAHG